MSLVMLVRALAWRGSVMMVWRTEEVAQTETDGQILAFETYVW